MDVKDENKLNFTFAGCGFMGIYHVGVASCLREYAPEHMVKHKIGGASAGALVAALLICEAPLGFCTSWTLNLAAKARQRSLGPMHPSFNITDHLRKGMEDILPANAHETCTNRLHISMTRVRDGKNVVVKEFNSRNELIQALLCSAFIPLWSGLVPPEFRGERYVDGALSDNLPKIDSYTITVSPFAGRSDICPRDESMNIYYLYLSNTSIQLSMRNIYRLSRIMFPPHPEKLSEICRQGFEDTLAYLKTHDLVNCSRHLAIRSVLSRRTESICRDMDELDSLEEDEEDNHSCEHCVANHRQDRDLHPSVITALEEAVNVVNSSYLLYLKNTKPYRTFSVICSPIYLPFDVTAAIFIRLLRYLPSLTTDVKWLVDTAMWYARLLSGKVITRGRHHYTAQFVCQLAITEVQQADVMCDMVTRSRAQIHDQRFGFGLGLSTTESIEYIDNLRDKCVENKSADSLDIHTAEVQNPHIVVRRSLNPSRVASRAASRCPSRSISRAASRATSRRASFSDPTEQDDRSPLNEFADSHYGDLYADHTEAILAYYYKDDDGQLKTTEIFKLEEAEKRKAVPSPADLVSALAAKKLRQYGSTRSVISAEGFDNSDDDLEGSWVAVPPNS